MESYALSVFGKRAKGGTEWFHCVPTQALPTIYKWIKYYRKPELLLSKVAKIAVDKAYFYDARVALLHSEGWLKLPQSEICFVKVRSLSHVIVRLINNQRYVLDCSNLNYQDLKSARQFIQEDFNLITNGFIRTYEHR